MLGEVGSLEPAEGFDRVCYPGQIEGEKRRERAKDGIPIDPGLCQELRELAETFRIPPPV